mmetsp:Transcript_64110/g.171654  ORF Transcript_64110/g.171654 Transcript_64110/m.171654 type:complete len:220 (+) Transcript_64110:1005-1664(+)
MRFRSRRWKKQCLLVKIPDINPTKTRQRQRRLMFSMLSWLRSVTQLLLTYRLPPTSSQHLIRLISCMNLFNSDFPKPAVPCRGRRRPMAVFLTGRRLLWDLMGVSVSSPPGQPPGLQEKVMPRIRRIGRLTKTKMVTMKTLRPLPLDLEYVFAMCQGPKSQIHRRNLLREADRLNLLKWEDAVVLHLLRECLAVRVSHLRHVLIEELVQMESQQRVLTT